MAVHDYVCSACEERFSVTDPAGDVAPGDAAPVDAGPGDVAPGDVAPVCPACGSGLVRELWESRFRNAPTPPRPIEEMRDCVG